MQKFWQVDAAHHARACRQANGADRGTGQERSRLTRLADHPIVELGTSTRVSERLLALTTNARHAETILAGEAFYEGAHDALPFPALGLRSEAGSSSPAASAGWTQAETGTSPPVSVCIASDFSVRGTCRPLSYPDQVVCVTPTALAATSWLIPACFLQRARSTDAHEGTFTSHIITIAML